MGQSEPFRSQIAAKKANASSIAARSIEAANDAELDARLQIADRLLKARKLTVDQQIVNQQTQGSIASEMVKAHAAIKQAEPVAVPHPIPVPVPVPHPVPVLIGSQGRVIQ